MPENYCLARKDGVAAIMGRSCTSFFGESRMMHVMDERHANVALRMEVA